MKKQNIFIDFDGTICFDYFWRSAPQEVNKIITKFLFQDNTTLIENWMRGNLSSENIVTLIAENTGLDYDLIYDILVKDCQNMYISPKLLQALSDCGKNNTTILITDNMDCFNRFTKPALRLEKYFSYVFNSYDFGILKDDTTSGGLFKKVCDIYKFDITKSVLVDNSEENCTIFTKLGVRAVLVKSQEETLSILQTIY